MAMISLYKVLESNDYSSLSQVEDVLRDYVKPRKVSGDLAKEIYIYGTYSAFHQIKKSHDKEWIKHTQERNALVERNASPEEFSRLHWDSPKSLWYRIENYLWKYSLKELNKLQKLFTDIVKDVSLMETIMTKLDLGESYKLAEHYNRTFIPVSPVMVKYDLLEMRYDVGLIQDVIRARRDDLLRREAITEMFSGPIGWDFELGEEDEVNSESTIVIDGGNRDGEIVVTY